MRTIKFPKMFNTNNTRVWKSSEHLDATKQSTILLLHSMRGELFGDPYFGIMLKRYLFDQNSYILRDAIIDMIYTQLAIFIPQIKVKREDINIVQDKAKGRLECTFSGINQIDYTHNTYNLVLFDERD
jgi:phage baseplate assembly protein W